MAFVILAYATIPMLITAATTEEFIPMWQFAYFGIGFLIATAIMERKTVK